MGREEVAIDRSEDVFCCGKQGGIEQLGLNLMEDLSVLGNHGAAGGGLLRYI